MTERELRKLSRVDLLGLLVEQMKENERLSAELEAAQERLSERMIELGKAGSIAEASLQLNGVFQSAQAACAQYIENIERLSTQQEEICSRMEQETQEKCARMEQETQEKCDQMVADAKSRSQAYWEDVSCKVRELTSSYAELRAILQQSPQSDTRR